VSGVWVVYYEDYGHKVAAIFEDELGARRYSDAEGGWYLVSFIPFGEWV
jgi:hypothetical protein